MSIFDIFSNQAKTDAPPVAPTTPGNLQDPNNVQQQQTQQTAPDGNIPPTTPETPPETPLDQFKTLWHNEPKDKETPPEQQQLTKEQVAEIVNNADFTSAITPEVAEQITSGGEGAVTAFKQALNAAARDVMTQATLVSNELSNRAARAAVDKQQKELPGMLRGQAISNYMQDSNPLLADPAIKPVAEAAKDQLQLKFPNASPAEITELTINYIQGMGQAFAPKPESQQQEPESVDWEDWIKS